MNDDSRQSKLAFYFASLALFFSLCAPIFLAPLCAQTGYKETARLIYLSYHKLCHQLPERSFSLLSHQLAVCHRCTGIYLGLVLGALLYPFFFGLNRTDLPDRKYLMLMSTPIALDLFLPLLGLWENTAISRFLTGLIFGATASFYAIPGLRDMGGKLKPFNSTTRRKL